MNLQKIWLKNFRNFEDKLISFSPSLTIILGDNASGKTNILEAINLLATGKSFKAGKNQEMIKDLERIARVKGKLPETTLEVILTHGSITEGAVTQKTAKKRLLVADTPKRIDTFASHFQTVVFRPQDLDLVTQSPSIRRKFLDTVLGLSDREYVRSLRSYEKGLRSRNKLLLKIREENTPRKSLAFWDMLLIKNGDYINRARRELIDFINSQEQIESKKHLQLVYDASAISEARLAQYAREEIYAGTTLVGPHRDDVSFLLNKKSLSDYGSRGEQRMGVLWVKLAEIAYLEAKKGIRPVLLLDDIFSELDHDHRKIIESLFSLQQTIITAADPHYVEGLHAEIISL